MRMMRVLGWYLLMVVDLPLDSARIPDQAKQAMKVAVDLMLHEEPVAILTVPVIRH